ncbi:phosphatase PAP2 family protein [Flavobacterium humi]|uniref:Phosphatase PAP2 family protein n=1 Tax=Flavobacterium humi TaxID=2562683 RepID=A0A4Z0L6I6_9FLAO|nr:phosphatase PAP2 family protein [Flavobacterium humi]TGD57861.1 phosphatase PAP2 family protein [Flavobacterium humi]
MVKKLNLIIIVLLLAGKTFGQNKPIDSLNIDNIKFRQQALILPIALIGYGVISLESHTLKDINAETKEEFNEHIDEKLSLDDFSQYSPFVSVYVLNNAGIKGKNNLKDRTIILGTAYLIMGATINIIKNTGNELRPDGTSYNSFPSGHTATAFMGAEFLYQEYKNVSVWYGISGYMVAAGTGFFRMYNDRHWLGDVSAGAGIGILSTKIAYWIHPLLKRTIFKGKENLNGMIIPVYNGKQLGLSMAVTF